MKIGIAQINTVAGDYPGNARRVLQAYRECLEGGAEWVVAPELVLAGYEVTPGGAEKCLQALDYLATEIGSVPLVLGHLDHGGGSAASVLAEGEVRVTFREAITFTWGERSPCLVLGKSKGKDRTAGWPKLHLARERFRFDGLDSQRAALTARALDCRALYVHCNAIGGARDEVYAGGSMVISLEGKILEVLPRFEECCRVIDTGLDAPAVAPRVEDDVIELRKAIMLGLADCVRKAGYLGVALHRDGSPGAEVLLHLATEALGADQVHAITFSPETLDVAPVAESLRKALAPWDAVPVPGELEALMLASIARRAGLLPLLAANRSEIAGGDFAPVPGLAPLGDLAVAILLCLIQQMDPPPFLHGSLVKADMARMIVDADLSPERLIARGRAEEDVLLAVRKVARTRLPGFPKPDILRLGH